MYESCGITINIDAASERRIHMEELDRDEEDEEHGSEYAANVKGEAPEAVVVAMEATMRRTYFVWVFLQG